MSRRVSRCAASLPGTEAALPILGDVDLQDAGVVGVGAVELVAVEQQHAVGVTVAPARRLRPGAKIGPDWAPAFLWAVAYAGPWAAETSAFAVVSRCAEEDSNLHGP
jgi:hypothetical protein